MPPEVGYVYQWCIRHGGECGRGGCREEQGRVVGNERGAPPVVRSRRVCDDRTGAGSGASAGVCGVADGTGQGWCGGSRALSPTVAWVGGVAGGLGGFGAQSGSGG